jgi:hypothetical protein
MIAQIQLRRGTTAEWSASTVVLASGEPGFDTSLSRMKIGDGTNLWGALPWASNADLESQIAALASGGPAGTYADLAALNTADPDHSKIYITLDNGNWCYYDTGTGAFVAGGVYQATEVADGSITRGKLDFSPADGEQTVNLYDKSAITEDKYIIPGTGTLSDAAGFSVSDWIAVDPSTDYVSSGTVWRMTLYDSGKNYISNTDVDVASVTTTAGTAYIRITVREPLTYTDTFMFCAGTVLPTAYIAYGFYAATGSVYRTSLEPNIQKRIGCGDFEILLPSDIYMVSGESYSIYYSNIVNYSQAYRNGNMYMVALEKTGVSTYAAKGLTYDYKWECTPLNTDTTFDMEFRLVSTYDEVTLASKVVTFHVANSADAGNQGRTGNIIILGDSFVDLYHVAEKIDTDLTTKSGINNPSFLGQRLSGTTHHDAYAGITYNGYVTEANSFFNPVSETFDFSYYMTTYYPTYVPAGTGSPHVNTVCMMAGLNDVGWKYVSNSGIHIALMITNINTIITSVHAFDPAIVVLIYTIVPQIHDQNQIGIAFDTFSHHERINYILGLANKAIIDEFDTVAMKAANVYVMPSAANFDYRYGMVTADTFAPVKFDPTITETHATNIHPSDIGAEYIADTVYQYIYNLGLE